LKKTAQSKSSKPNKKNQMPDTSYISDNGRGTLSGKGTRRRRGHDPKGAGVRRRRGKSVQS